MRKKKKMKEKNRVRNVCKEGVTVPLADCSHKAFCTAHVP